MRSFHKLIAVAVAGLATFAPASANSNLDIVQTAASTPGFETLTALVGQAGLTATLQGPGPFTVFAPTNAAFAALDPNLVAYLTDPANVEDLRSVLTYHVVADELGASEVLISPFLATVNGQRAYLRTNLGQLFIDNVPISVTDIICSNGIIHVLGGVMQPNLKPIADTAAATNRFDTLIAALGAADLAAALDMPGPFTVLAPTDVAFASLPAGTIESLLEPQNKPLLQKILKYHVVPGRLYSDQALAGVRFTTLAGPVVEFNLFNGVPRVNAARILRADLDTANGVVHAIDRVLLPPLN